MPKKPLESGNDKKTTRVQLELTDASMTRLNELKDMTEATSYAEVTRQSYKIHLKLLKLQENGGTLRVIEANGNVFELMIM